MMYIWCPPFLIGRCAPLANVLVRPPMGLGVSAPHFPQALLETMRTGIAIMELWKKQKTKQSSRDQRPRRFSLRKSSGRAASRLLGQAVAPLITS